MGFKRKAERTIDDVPGCKGFVMVVRRPTFGVAMQLAETNGSRVDTARYQELLGFFADCLVSWNLEDDDDQPIPPTLEGLRSQDDEFVLLVFDAWVDFVVRGAAKGPLGSSSPDGEQPLEASLPMEPLPENQAS